VNKSVETEKTDNVTETDDYSFEESDVDSDGMVTQTLGNNGRIDITNTGTITVNASKKWTVSHNECSSVKVELYATGTMDFRSFNAFGYYDDNYYFSYWKSDVDYTLPDNSSLSLDYDSTYKFDDDGTVNNGKRTFTVYLGSFELSKKYNWKDVAENIPTEIDTGYSTITFENFYLRETPVGDYMPSYTNSSNGKVIKTQDMTVNLDGKETDIKVVPISISSTGGTNTGKVTITNSKYYTLPSAGGIGTVWFTVGGVVIMITACLAYIIYRRRRKITVQGGDR
jgi:LPXTG-motif cell wall-anchored protein